MRGLLLTSYGFSIFGAKGDQVATVAIAGAGLMVVLSAAGFLHALLTPRSQRFPTDERLTADGERRQPTAA